jgi:DNA repair protein RecO (recombination protein O)
MTPIIRETDGIVLARHDHGESDLIITLYCRDSGRSTAIAKGAKKSQRRFVNKLELFSFLHLNLRQGNSSSLALLEEADLHTSFLNLRRGFSLYTAASVIREFTLLATREGEADERFYTLLLWSLHKLDQKVSHLQVVMFFLTRFYDIIGYRPELHRCFHCGAEAGNSTPHFGFSTAVGGLICSTCVGNMGQSGIALNPGTIRMMQSCQDTPLERLHRLKVSEASLYEALNILHRYGRHILQRDIISWKMLRRTISSQQERWENQR